MKRKLGFSLLQVTYWCSEGAFAVFMSAYAVSLGVSTAGLGVLLALYTFGGFIGQFALSGLSDALCSNKKVFIPALALSLASEWLFFFNHDFTVMLVSSFVFGFLIQPLAANIDTWVLRSFPGDRHAYGPIRSAGSLSYSALMFFFGTFLEKNGYFYMLVFSAAFGAAAMITAAFIPDAAAPAGKREKTDLRPLLRSSRYLSLLTVLFLSGVSAAPVWTFAIIILKSMGGTVRHIGYSSFTSALIQVPIVFFAGSFRRFRPEFRIFLGMLMYIIYIFGDSLTSSPDVFVILSGISGLGFGLLLPAMREYVFRIMPGKLATTAQGVCDAMNGCLGMLAGNLLFSLMYGAVSIPAILRIDAAILAAGLAVFTINALIMDRRERRCCEAAPCERAQR